MIQEAFDVAIPAGAMSGKVSGAGGGGFIMFMVEPTKKKDVISALSGLSGFVMPFQFTDGGAHGWKFMSQIEYECKGYNQRTDFSQC